MLYLLVIFLFCFVVFLLFTFFIYYDRLYHDLFYFSPLSFSFYLFLGFSLLCSFSCDAYVFIIVWVSIGSLSIAYTLLYLCCSCCSTADHCLITEFISYLSTFSVLISLFFTYYYTKFSLSLP